MPRYEIKQWRGLFSALILLLGANYSGLVLHTVMKNIKS